MHLNIKNPETHQMAQELAEATGETLTGAVTEAVRERLDRVRAGARSGLAERLLDIGRDAARRLSAAQRSVDHADTLYGDDGLPR